MLRVLPHTTPTQISVDIPQHRKITVFHYTLFNFMTHLSFYMKQHHNCHVILIRVISPFAKVLLTVMAFLKSWIKALRASLGFPAIYFSYRLIKVQTLFPFASLSL